MLKLFLSALWSAVLAIIGLERKNPIVEVEKRNASIAEKQAAIVADHTAPDAVASLRDGKF